FYLTNVIWNTEVLICCFFFSSRRRHTRSKRDWSSDVCSSDLRRTELNLTMPELGKRIGVNKSTIQRYEADGVDPKRTMIINGLRSEERRVGKECRSRG